MSSCTFFAMRFFGSDPIHPAHESRMKICGYGSFRVRRAHIRARSQTGAPQRTMVSLTVALTFVSILGANADRPYFQARGGEARQVASSESSPVPTATVKPYTPAGGVGVNASEGPPVYTYLSDFDFQSLVCPPRQLEESKHPHCIRTWRSIRSGLSSTCFIMVWQCSQLRSSRLRASMLKTGSLLSGWLIRKLAMP